MTRLNVESMAGFTLYAQAPGHLSRSVWIIISHTVRLDVWIINTPSRTEETFLRGTAFSGGLCSYVIEKYIPNVRNYIISHYLILNNFIHNNTILFIFVYYILTHTQFSINFLFEDLKKKTLF